MSAGGAEQGGDGQDFEINLAPIIDCFTVLITYMLVSASFISLDILNVQVNPTSSTAEAPLDKPPATFGIFLRENRELELIVTDKQAFKTVLAPNGTAWNVSKMDKKIKTIQERWPAIQEVNIRAEAGVQYKEVVFLIEQLKRSLPRVVLGE